MNERNTKFTVLSMMGMILVILGHLDWDGLTFFGLFPYYSFHVLIFVFISGYFYKPESETNIAGYIGHKCKTLLVPYFIWNLVYGLIATILHEFGFSIGGQITLYNLFIAPFVGGHQFIYNAAAWFVPALFMLEVCNVLGRKLLGCLKIKNEWVIFALYLLVGCFAVFMAKRGSVYDYYKIPGRLMVMAPAFALGRVYREKLEKYDITPSYIYIPLLFVMNFILVKTHGGLAYSVVWVTGFANTFLTPFITMLTGIALWLRISRIIAGVIENKNGIAARFIRYFGNNTYSVMMHQLIIFMGVKEVFYLLYKAGSSIGAGFDEIMYHGDVYYTFVPYGIEAFKIVYAILAIALSLCIAFVIQKGKGLVREGKN